MAVHIALAVIVVIATAYFAGRVHEWYRHGFEREVAYREGYDQASRALFKLAVRKVPTKPEVPAPTGPVRTQHSESTAERLRPTGASQY